MNGQQYDLIIVGGGPGGYPAAIRASQKGLKVAVVEKYKVGGTCLQWGCVPTKVILESAEILSTMKRSQEFGISAENVTLNFDQVAKRRDKVVVQHTQGTEWLLKKNNVTLIIGEARLTAPTTVQVTPADGGEVTQLSAKDVIIATGSAPQSLPGVTMDGEKIINSDQAVTLGYVPKSVVIIGAGAIGSEFASAWNDLGAEVTLVEMLPTVVPLEDPEVGQELAKQFKRRGIKVMAGAKVKLESIKAGKGGVELEIESEGSSQKLQAEKLLIATGRGAVTQGLGLEELGVKMERGFIKVDGQMGTGIPHLYAIGDVVGGLMLAHKATHEGFIAVEAILGNGPRPLDSNRIPRCTYTRPQVASVGISEEEARKNGRQVKVGNFPFSANSMATILSERIGFAKVVTDEESGEILGVHLLGPRVTELIYGPALAKLLESTMEEVALNVYPHPTLSEAIGEAAEDSQGMMINFYRDAPSG